MSNLQYLLYNLSQCSNYWSAEKAPNTPFTGVKTLSRRYYKFTATTNKTLIGGDGTVLLPALMVVWMNVRNIWVQVMWLVMTVYP